MARKTDESTDGMWNDATATLTTGPQPAQKADVSGVGDGNSVVPMLTDVEDHKGQGKRTQIVPSPIKKHEEIQEGRNTRGNSMRKFRRALSRRRVPVFRCFRQRPQGRARQTHIRDQRRIKIRRRRGRESRSQGTGNQSRRRVRKQGTRSRRMRRIRTQRTKSRGRRVR